MDISFTPVEFLEPIKSLSKLINLNLSGIRVNDFGPVGYLPNLKVLNLASTNFADIGYLSLCSKLEHLSLSGTRVSNFGAIEKLVNLQKLSLLGLQIDVDLIRSLPKIKELWVSDVSDNDKEKLSRIENLSVHYSRRFRHGNDFYYTEDVQNLDLFESSGKGTALSTALRH